MAHETFNKYQKKRQLGISISRQFIETLNNANELVYIIIHEVNHILSNHLSRGMTIINQQMYNIACDHVINSALDADIRDGRIRGVKIPNDRTIINSLLGKNLSAEEVYKYLMDHATITTEKYKFKIDEDGNFKLEGDGNNSDQENDPNSQSNEGSIEVSKIHVKLDDGQEFTFYQDIHATGKQVEDQERDLQDDARRLLNSPIFEAEKRKGDKGSRLVEMIQEAIRVDIPWDTLLENVIKTNITEKSENKTWSRINKRMTAYNMILPYHDTEETYESLLVFIDTSGSISSYDLSKFVHIIKASMYHFKKVIKIDHDVEVYDKYKIVYDNSTINNLQTDIKVEFTGRGGTSHKFVYDYIELIYEGVNNDIQIPGLILFITDFMSDIESIHHTYKWVKEIPYKYIITANSRFDIDPTIDKSPIFILN